MSDHSLTTDACSAAAARFERRTKMGDQDSGDTCQTDMIERRRIPASRSRLYRPALVAAGIGLLLSLAGASAVGQWEERVTRVEFEGVAETQAIIMQNGVNEYVSRLAALRTLFESANEEITRSEFATFSRRLFSPNPGILRISWIPRINRKERAEYEAAAVGDGISGYRIKSLLADGDVATAPQGDEYFPLFFSTSPKTSVVYGLDYSTDPARWATLERARDNGLVATLRAELYESKGGIWAQGVLVCVPVYVKGTSRATIADRRRNLAGFVVGIVSLPRLLGSIRTTTAATPAVRIDVYPSDIGGSAGPENRFVPDFSSEPNASQSAVAEPAHWSGTLKIGDASWHVRATPTADGRLTTRHERALTVLAAGIAITTFLAVYLGLASRNSRQLALANRRGLGVSETDH